MGKLLKKKLAREFNGGLVSDVEGKVAMRCEVCPTTVHVSPAQLGRVAAPRCPTCGRPTVLVHQKKARKPPKARRCKGCGCRLSVSNRTDLCRPCTGPDGKVMKYVKRARMQGVRQSAGELAGVRA
jgi:hypothetical protein